MSYNRTNIKFLQRDIKIGRYLFTSKIPIKRQLLEVKGLGKNWVDKYFLINNFKDCKFSDMPEKMLKKITDLLEKNFYDGEMPNFFKNYSRHLIGTQLLIRKKIDIKKLQAAKTLRGTRHRLKLRVRGQRTKSTGRKNKKSKNRR